MRDNRPAAPTPPAQEAMDHSASPAQSTPGVKLQGQLKGSKSAAKASEDGNFALQMEAQAAAMAQVNAQANPVQLPRQWEFESSSPQAGMKTLAGQPAQAFGGRNVASAKTGAMTAGLQPQGAMPFASPIGREWVFEGVDQNPNLKTLFGSSSPKQVPLEAGVDGKNSMIPNQPIQQRGEIATPGLDLGPDAEAVRRLLSQAAEHDSEMGQVTEKTGMRWDTLSAPPAAHAVEAQTTTASTQTAESAQALAAGQWASADGRGFVGDFTTSDRRGDKLQGLSARQGGGGSVALSGGDFLSTLSSVKAGDGKQEADTGDSEAGEQSPGFGKFGGKSAEAGSGLKKKSSLEGGSSVLEQSAGAGSVLVAQKFEGSSDVQTAAPKEMRAQVTQGGMTQNRLATDSVLGLSANIRNLTPQGGGEIRVRLNPENLGELNVRVVTDGQKVGLQIQASDEKAKKILELSMGDLKDSLAKQQLNLSHIELSVGQAQHSSLAGGFGGESHSSPQQQHSSQGFQSFQGSLEQGGGRSGYGSNQQEGGASSRDSREGWNSSPLRTSMPNRGIASSVGSRGAGAMGGQRRLDVRA